MLEQRAQTITEEMFIACSHMTADVRRLTSRGAIAEEVGPMVGI